MNDISQSKTISMLSQEPNLTEAEKNWLMFRFPFLTAACFQAAVEMEWRDRARSQQNTARQGAQPAQSPYEAARSFVLSALFAQMEELVSLAMTDSAEGKTARKIICLLLISSIEMPIEGREHCQTQAARALVILTMAVHNPLSPGSDPRLKPLKGLLADGNERIRLAACRAILSQGQYGEKLDEQLGCLGVLADLAVNSPSPLVSGDALTLIQRLQNQCPILKKLIDRACVLATGEFIRAQKEFGMLRLQLPLGRGGH